jgi:hypothetical protein
MDDRELLPKVQIVEILATGCRTNSPRPVLIKDHMKHKTAELDGPLLDAAVAKAEGFTEFWWSESRGCFVYQAGPQHHLSLPSMKEWGNAGPLIERERIIWNSFVSGEWEALALAAPGLVERIDKGKMRGPTPLIAAMRAYVASKFGEEVELPNSAS